MDERSIRFLEWVTAEITSKGWAVNEFARRAKLPYSSTSAILNGQMKVSYKFCMGVARAFNGNPEAILRQAGLLPDLPYGPLDEMTLKELVDLMRTLTPGDRYEVLQYAKLRQRLAREERNG